MVLILCSEGYDCSRHSLQVASVKRSVLDLKAILHDTFGINETDIYLLHNGRKIPENAVISDGIIQAVPRLIGGKGGFGSMLRAIGAQIEKTTNREACRDLSGRRLRDINEEKRLKNWIAQQAEREREAAERKRKKLERLRAEPHHTFTDQTYEEERSLLTEKVSDAVEQGFKLASSSSVGNGQKRKAPCTTTSATKKKKNLWLDPEEEELSSSVDSDDSDGGDFAPKLPRKEEKQGISDAVGDFDKSSTSKGIISTSKNEDSVIPSDNDKPTASSSKEANI